MGNYCFLSNSSRKCFYLTQQAEAFGSSNAAASKSWRLGLDIFNAIINQIE